MLFIDIINTSHLENSWYTVKCSYTIKYKKSLFICHDILQIIGYITQFFPFEKFSFSFSLLFFFFPHDPWWESKCLPLVFLLSAIWNLSQGYISVQNEYVSRKCHILSPLSYSLIVNSKHETFSMEICWFVSGCSWQWVNNRLFLSSFS